MEKLTFASDYMEGALPEIMEKLTETNLEQTSGYGTDQYCTSAAKKILEACGCPDGEVYFLVGGTQTNATVIDAVLQIYQGVMAAQTGHVALHEAGAIEAGGHKVLALPHHEGKVSPETVRQYLKDFYADGNHEHMVMPGMLYISQPTEYGTLYSKEELTALSTICHEYSIPLYADGARMAYGLGSEKNDVTLRDMAELCDVFYIGGTKCGALFGEAVVIPQKGRIPHFFTIMKQHGALLAKGRMLGIQFDLLFSDERYLKIGAKACAQAQEIDRAFRDQGYDMLMDTVSNQVFPILENDVLEKLSETVETSFWEKYDDSHTVVRLAASWATEESAVEKLKEIVKSL